MIFKIDKKQTEKLNIWFNIHKQSCEYFKNPGAIGGLLSFIFTPNGIGEALEVKCICGEQIDLTDMDNW